MSKIPMTVAGIAVDPSSGQPILVLKDKTEKLSLPVWLSIVEANAIATVLSGSQSPPHTLVADVIAEMGGRIEAVVIDSAEGGTFYATIEISGPGGPAAVQARAADAVALALAEGVPIEASKELLLSAKLGEVEEGEEGEEESSLADKMRELLESLTPEDFGKYRM